MIRHYYKDKSILITGTTGFVGKVVLEKILRTFEDVKMIYISIRVPKNEPGELYNRYKAEVKDSMVFDHLKYKLGLKRWRGIMKNKITLLPMDLTKESLGLNPDQLNDL